MSQRNPQQGLARQQPGQQGISRVVTGTLTRLSDNTETKQLTTYDPEEAVSWIDEAAVKGHVVTPSMMPVFPHGRGLACSIVRITDFDKQGTQLYPIQGSSNLGLHKNVLDEIGRGYGIDWPPHWTFREPFTLPGAQQEDPRDKDPFCIKITVAGRYKRFDGTWSALPPLTKEIDLREGSAEVEQIRVRQEEKELKDLPAGATEQAIAQRKAFAKRKADAEIAQLRKFIRAHAQTKARLQVIGTLVRRSYSAEELKKPFYVFSSVWTGRSSNPEIDMMLAKGSLEMEKEGRAVLWGGTAASPKELPAADDAPYTEDAEITAYETALSQETAVPTEDTAQAQTEVKVCTPDECFGRGARHVRACSEPVETKSATSQPEQATLPTEQAEVKDAVLSALSSQLDNIISQLERDGLSDAEAEKLKQDQKQIEEAIEVRRKALK